MIAWARATDGAYDVFVDTNNTSVKEFEAPPVGRVSSVEGLIRSLGAAAQDNLNQDVYSTLIHKTTGKPKSLNIIRSGPTHADSKSTLWLKTKCSHQPVLLAALLTVHPKPKYFR